MKTKSQAFDIFQKFICQEKRQSEKKLKHLYTDFGEEFAYQVFEEYTAKEGVKWKLSTPYIPK